MSARVRSLFIRSLVGCPSASGDFPLIDTSSETDWLGSSGVPSWLAVQAKGFSCWGHFPPIETPDLCEDPTELRARGP